MKIDGNAFVIGGSGIGEACALAFARFGARSIGIADVNLAAAEAVASHCKSLSTVAGFTAVALHVDITIEESTTSAFEHFVAAFGRIDYCVNSAGIGVRQAREVADVDLHEFNHMLNVNVTGTLRVLRVASAIMKAQEARPVNPAFPARGTIRGAIVVLGSASAFSATPNMIQYTAAKHAVAGLVKNAALDNARHGIRVNSVCPSWVDTPMIRQAMQDVPGLEEMIKTAVPLGRIATAEEVADAVVFLCSPLASYATGLNMILDGGTTLTSHA